MTTLLKKLKQISVIGISIPFFFLSGCSKENKQEYISNKEIKQEVKEIEPFVGYVVGESTKSSYNRLRDFQSRANINWALVVQESSTDKRKVFNYTELSVDFEDSRINKIFALDNAINKGNLVTIHQYSDGSYSYPE